MKEDDRRLISIVIPTYNQGRFIEDCLKSILTQSYQDIEIIIHDSESTDETRAICTRYQTRDSRIAYFCEKDSGQSDAINRGLRKSRGFFWTWLCSDDCYASRDALESLVSAFHQRGGLGPVGASCAGVYGDAELMDDRGTPIRPYESLQRSVFWKDFKLDWPLAQPAVLLIREKVFVHGGVDALLDLGMDLDLFIRLLQGGEKLLYTPTLIAKVRVHPDSKSEARQFKTAVNALSIVRRHFGTVGNPLTSMYAFELGAGIVRRLYRLLLLDKIRHFAEMPWVLSRISQLRWTRYVICAIARTVHTTLVKLFSLLALFIRPARKKASHDLSATR